MFARCSGQLESLRTREDIKENMTSRQTQEMQIIITQVSSGTELREKGIAFLKPLNTNVRGKTRYPGNISISSEWPEQNVRERVSVNGTMRWGMRVPLTPGYGNPVS